MYCKVIYVFDELLSMYDSVSLLFCLLLFLFIVFCWDTRGKIFLCY